VGLFPLSCPSFFIHDDTGSYTKPHSMKNSIIFYHRVASCIIDDKTYIIVYYMLLILYHCAYNFSYDYFMTKCLSSEPPSEAFTSIPEIRRGRKQGEKSRSAQRSGGLGLDAAAASSTLRGRAEHAEQNFSTYRYYSTLQSITVYCVLNAICCASL
jgi:hypothetical protein